MDPFTHILGGVVAGALLGADQAAMAVAAVSALAPDAEFVTRRIPRTAFLDYHHGVSHTVPGGLLLSVFIALAAATITQRPWGALLPFASSGVASHVVLDLLMHNNGIALFAPFSRRRFSFPLVLGLNPQTSSPSCPDRRYGTCIACQARGLRFNPFFWVLLAGTLMCVTFPRFARGWALLSVAILVAVCVRADRRRRAALAMVPSAPGVVRHKAFPADHRVARWLVLTELPDRFDAALVDSAGGEIVWRLDVPKRPPPEPVARSEKLLSVRGFKNSVMFPSWSYESRDGLHHVTWRDLSYLFSQEVELYTLHVAFEEGGGLVQNEFHERW